MFNNFINRKDVYDLLGNSQRIFAEMASRMSINSQKRVAGAWKHTSSPPTNWWNVPQVRQRWNTMISGDPQIDFYRYIADKYLSTSNQLKALSIGCGNGSRELSWARTSCFSEIDAFDLSETRIKAANKKAAQVHLDTVLNYRVGDALQVELAQNHYDVAFGEGSLHHFSPLETILLKYRQAMKPGAYFIINEYVGPDRFQWTDRQLQAVNNALTILPRRYKSLWDKDKIRRKVYRPSRLRMLVSDPSEAIESSSILPLLKKHFEVVEIKGFGGAILHLLFNGIAHNFLAEDSDTERWLKTVFAIEDLLLTEGEIEHDFVVAVFKKPLSE